VSAPSTGAPAGSVRPLRRRGVLLAGGSGTRLDPLTRVVCKQLLPVYDKPMIYYPLSLLMLGGLRDVLIVSTPRDLPILQRLLGDGAWLGMNLSYAAQGQPEGIAQALLIAAAWLEGAAPVLVLGDNLIYGDLRGFQSALALEEGACIFAVPSAEPQLYGVVELDPSGRPLSIEEKPTRPRSALAVPGLYVYDGRAVDWARDLRPSARGELEITDLNRAYLRDGSLRVELLGGGLTWLDMGTPETLLEASQVIAALERHGGHKVACLEEIALAMGFIDGSGLGRIIGGLPPSAYRSYLEAVLERGGGR